VATRSSSFLALSKQSATLVEKFSNFDPSVVANWAKQFEILE
jgi:hypothetical protein